MSPLLFVIVMEAVSRVFRVALPWELLHADDVVVIAETKDDLIKGYNEWKDNMENRRMRVNMNTRNPAKASGGRPYETGSRNMAATKKMNFLTLVSYSLLQTLFG